LPYHAHGEDVDVYIRNGICETVDEEGGFRGCARGTIWVPVGGDGVALLFPFNFLSLSLLWKIREGGTYKYHHTRKYNSPNSDKSDTAVDDSAVGGCDSETEVE
jgi:hypothetical protein